MFEQVRKFGAEIKEPAASASLDLATVPEATNGAGELGSVPLEVIGSCAGLAVVQVEPLGALGAEATGFIGMQIQKRLRAMQAGQGPLEPGELFAGQAAERERELQGAPYESYYAPGKLTSRGRTLDALAQGYVGGAHGSESLAALAALALRCVEGS